MTSSILRQFLNIIEVDEVMIVMARRVAVTDKAKKKVVQDEKRAFIDTMGQEVVGISFEGRAEQGASNSFRVFLP